jgi:type IV pilus assembly protein PilM
MSNLLTSTGDFFGLDIGTTAIRLVQLRGDGNTKALVKYAYVPIDSAMSISDSKNDQQKLSQVVAQLVKQASVNTNRVAVGIPSDRVFTTVSDVDKLSRSELAKAIPYQADSLIPTPLAESKIDWVPIGDSPVDKTKQEVLLTSVTNKYVESRLDILEAIGLNVVAFEPDNLAMARALATPDPSPQLLVDMGHRGTDLVIVMNEAPHLTRSLPTGMEAINKAAMQNLNVDQKQAEQFVKKFGMSKDKLEGQVYEAIIATVDLLTTEIEKSIKFFHTRYSTSNLSKIVVTGGAAVIPEFPLYLANKFGISVEIGNAWQNVSFSADRQNELLTISHQFGVAVGLAERNS